MNDDSAERQPDMRAESSPAAPGAEPPATVDATREQEKAAEGAIDGEAFPEIPEVYYLESIEQLRAISDPLRARIFEALVRRPLTVKRVATLLGEAPAKIHYHVRELERVGLLKLVETRERGGILEKDYRAVARILGTTASLLQAHPDAVITAARDSIQLIAQGFLRVLARATDPNVPAETMKGALLFIENISLWVTPEEHHQLMEQVMSLLGAYNAPRGIPGEREGLLALIGYDTRLAQEPAAVDEAFAIAWADAASESTEEQIAMPEISTAARIKRVALVGALSYSRADLEMVVAQGQRLDLDVLGYLAFTNDVTPDLIDRSIERLRYKGVLRASDATTVALMHKTV